MPEKQTVSFRIVPGENALLSANTVAGSLGEMEKLLRAVGRQHGVKTITSVSGIEYDNGAVTFHLLVTSPSKSAQP